MVWDGVKTLLHQFISYFPFGLDLPLLPFKFLRTPKLELTECFIPLGCNFLSITQSVIWTTQILLPSCSLDNPDLSSSKNLTISDFRDTFPVLTHLTICKIGTTTSFKFRTKSPDPPLLATVYTASDILTIPSFTVSETKESSLTPEK